MTTETEQAPPPPPPAADEAEGSRDPLTRLIAISLASLVVLGSFLAILQTDASVHESTTAREATRAAVRAMRANVTENAVEGIEAELQGERSFLPYRRPLSADAPSLAEAVGLPAAPGVRARDLRAAEQGLPIARAQTALDRLRFDTAQATLKQQALATTRITWNTRSTQYTTVIAVLAAALFLVGFGLILEGRLRRFSYALGMAIAVGVAVMGAWLYHLSIPSTPDGAIDAAARAAVQADRRNFDRAVAEYDRSIAADDRFAPAYRGRAIARLLAANPDYQVTRAFTDLTGRRSAAARKDVDRALEFTRDRDFLALGVAALGAFYANDFDTAVERADAAIEINEDVPDVRLLKSAAELALGRPAAARASLLGALELLRGTEPSQRTRQLAATYLSYLQWVAWRVPGQAQEAQRLADEVVATETAFTLGRPVSRTLPAGSSVAVEDLRYADGRLTLRLRYRDLAKGTALSALEYERPLADGPWAQPTDLAVFLNLTGSGERQFSVPVERACEPTAVRVDVYLDGARASSTTGPGVAQAC